MRVAQETMGVPDVGSAVLHVVSAAPPAPPSMTVVMVVKYVLRLVEVKSEITVCVGEVVQLLAIVGRLGRDGGKEGTTKRAGEWRAV